MSDSIGTRLVHADDCHNTPEVAPSISVSTTFRLPQDVPLSSVDASEGKYNVYSRYSQDINTRLEKVLASLHGENTRALTFTSGLSSAFAVLLHLSPKRVAITDGYFGVHAGIDILRKASRNTLEIISLDADYQPGDVCWLETPVNPTGEVRDIQHYADKIHAVGGKLVVDATFGPPLISNPFEFGADIIMSSGTKYFGGHSDLLSGVLVVKSVQEWKELWHIRTYTGCVMGSLESWLMLRSLRTFHVRIPQQSATATSLAEWLVKVSKIPPGQSWDGVSGGIIHSVKHASLQPQPFVKKQLPKLYPATFAFLLASEDLASQLPHLLRIITPATSLGGIESLIEQRYKADGVTDPRLLRLSVGLEGLEDLKQDIRQGINTLAKRTVKL